MSPNRRLDRPVPVVRCVEGTGLDGIDGSEWSFEPDGSDDLDRSFRPGDPGELEASGVTEGVKARRRPDRLGSFVASSRLDGVWMLEHGSASGYEAPSTSSADTGWSFPDKDSQNGHIPLHNANNISLTSLLLLISFHVYVDPVGRVLSPFRLTDLF